MGHENETNTGKIFGIGLVLNTGFTIFELLAGITSGSLALVADGMHNLTDSLTLAIAYVADRIARRQPDAKRSYGYGRAKIIASLLNAGILLAIAGFIGYEAINRLGEPTEVPGLTVAAVAAVGIVINGSIAYVLRKQRHDLNARSAYINMLYDMLSSIGALVAGLAIALFGWEWLDSVVGIVIAGMLLWATAGIIKEALRVLLEGVPKDVDLRKVKQKLLQLDHVVDVDDIHAWMIDNNYYAFSCHLVVRAADAPKAITSVKQAKRLLASDFHFQHSTIEIEIDRDRTSAAHNHA